MPEKEWSEERIRAVMFVTERECEFNALMARCPAEFQPELDFLFQDGFTLPSLEKELGLLMAMGPEEKAEWMKENCPWIDQEA